MSMLPRPNTRSIPVPTSRLLASSGSSRIRSGSSGIPSRAGATANVSSSRGQSPVPETPDETPSVPVPSTSSNLPTAKTSAPARIQAAIKERIEKRAAEIKKRKENRKKKLDNKKPNEAKSTTLATSRASKKKTNVEQQRQQNLQTVEEETVVEEEENDVNDDLNEIFMTLFEAAVALYPTLPYRYRKNVQAWLNRLLDPNSTTQTIRNLYISFLVFQMGELTQILDPFDKAPPEKLDANTKHFLGKTWTDFYTDYKGEKPSIFVPAINEVNKCEVKPNEFFNDFPTPNNGLVAYGSVFSNHFN